MAGSAHPGNPQNAVGTKVPKHYSSFPLAYKHLTSERFGMIDLPFAQDVVRGDKVRLSLPHNLRSYTLKSPFFGVIRKNKDYFFVAKDAILPINADKVNVQPTIGDDVPYGVNCAIKNAPKKIHAFVRALYLDARNYRAETQDDEINSYIRWIRFLIIGSYFYSPGSLLAKSGYNISKQWRFSKSQREDPYAKLDLRGTLSFDTCFDDFFEAFASDQNFTFRFDPGSSAGAERSYSVTTETSGADRRRIVRLMVETLMDEPAIMWRENWLTTDVGESQSLASFQAKYAADGTYQYVNAPNFPGDDEDAPAEVLNYGRLAAYQIACHHFMSNDKIDYIFSAELYRELMGNYVTNLLSPEHEGDQTTFYYNGILVRFDWLSGFYLDYVLGSDVLAADETSSFIVSYIAGLFSWRRSLRYVDYYVGAKTNALAVGDPFAPVSAQGVNIIELSQKTAWTKLLFATNQLGSKAKKWLEGIFPGRSIEWDKHDPAFIGHSADMVVGEEVDNTGAAQFEDVGDLNTKQNSTTSIFRSRKGKDFAFDYSVALPGYVIGVTYYDIPRVYSDFRSRQMMALDRHDEFNPMLQYTGDQPIYLAEFDPTSVDSEVFGYQTKDMQYKQGINRATGAFSEGVLPSWYFDDAAFLDDVWHSDHQSPSKIRSHASELDKFYLSLTGWSLSTYFHFIEQYDVDFSGKRPMSFRPELKV